ncbi:unnamed protein product, partial [Meganyctiphanes norvegica]
MSHQIVGTKVNATKHEQARDPREASRKKSLTREFPPNSKATRPYAALRAGHCPSGSVTIGEQCLVFHLNTLSWDAAKDACATIGQSLASLTNPDDTVAYTYATYGDVNFWVGGTDADTEGTWLWLSGASIPNDPALFPWGSYEPNNCCGGEHCLELWPSKNGFNDNRCIVTQPYICQIAHEDLCWWKHMESFAGSTW